MLEDTTVTVRSSAVQVCQGHKCLPVVLQLVSGLSVLFTRRNTKL